MSSRRKYVIFGVLAAIMVVLDQWTKILAREVLQPLGYGQYKVVIDGFFRLRYSENRGVAFGMLQTLPGGRFILTLVALAAFALVIYYLRKTQDDQTILHVALGLVGGGAIGNLIDRLRFGYVVDFIQVYFRQHSFPAFNIADSAIVVGAFMIVFASKLNSPRSPSND